MKIKEKEQILFEALSKGLILDNVCPKYRKSPDSPNSEMFRTVYPSKLKYVLKDSETIQLSLFYHCSMGESCYQPDCPWSQVSYEMSMERKMKKKLEPFVEIES